MFELFASRLSRCFVALAIFFAGSARYLLPMAAPIALLASRQQARWLALGFALQLTLGLGGLAEFERSLIKARVESPCASSHSVTPSPRRLLMEHTRVPSRL